jgi:hypothetical protein
MSNYRFSRCDSCILFRRPRCFDQPIDTVLSSCSFIQAKLQLNTDSVADGLRPWFMSLDYHFDHGSCLFESGLSHCMETCHLSFIFFWRQAASVDFLSECTPATVFHFMKHFLVKWISNAQSCHTYLPWSGK